LNVRNKRQITLVRHRIVSVKIFPCASMATAMEASFGSGDDVMDTQDYFAIAVIAAGAMWAGAMLYLRRKL
jgi:hypothetical protein